ncbi:MAG: diguanylate cyclase, partial [Spirochaeta sp.]|nr:diguanylate cyclase [Spirochaeta sp.]
SISPAAPNGSHHHPEIVEQALSIVAQNIRQKDIAGQFSSDAVWVVLGRTGADDMTIPQNRIRNRVSKDAELATAMKRAELDVVVGVASYNREIHAPKNLIQAAEEALAPQAARLK